MTASSAASVHAANSHECWSSDRSSSGRTTAGASRRVQSAFAVEKAIATSPEPFEA